MSHPGRGLTAVGGEELGYRSDEIEQRIAARPEQDSDQQTRCDRGLVDHLRRIHLMGVTVSPYSRRGQNSIRRLTWPANPSTRRASTWGEPWPIR